MIANASVCNGKERLALRPTNCSSFPAPGPTHAPPLFAISIGGSGGGGDAQKRGPSSAPISQWEKQLMSGVWSGALLLAALSPHSGWRQLSAPQVHASPIPPLVLVHDGRLLTLYKRCVVPYSLGAAGPKVIVQECTCHCKCMQQHCCLPCTTT